MHKITRIMLACTVILLSIWNITRWSTNPSLNTTTSTTLMAQNEWFSAGDWRGIHVPWEWHNDDNSNEPQAFVVIKKTINWVLTLLSAIALILCLRWWFQMLTAAGDESKVKTWTKVLKHAAIWLIIIWLSWIIIRFIFRLITTFATTE